MKLLFLFLFLFLFLQCCYPTQAAKCTGVVCPKPELECNYPRIIVHLPDPKNKCCNITECICEGTSYRLSSSQSTRIQLDTFNRRYTNCTLIDGNLEIVYINSNRLKVLDSTKHVRIVTGYVLIALNKINVIDLSSLRLIRGEQLFRESLGPCNSSANANSRGYSFYVTSNLGGSKSGLREIRMPSITEIMAGDVRVNDNENLCFIDTIVWKGEILNSPEQRVDIVMSSKVTCPACSPDCINNKVDSARHCWGPSNDSCQSFFSLSCPSCPNRCNKHGQCCHSYCAGGCVDSKPTAACHTCKILNNFGECVQKCPSNFEVAPNVPVVVESQKRYQLSRYCVPKCPTSRRVLEQDAICVLTCPEGYYEESRKCIQCSPGKCDHICYGLGTGMGPLKNDDVIHVNNIKHFHKNCTIIEGSLVFRKTTFSGDNHCEIPGMTDDKMLDVFGNVEEITGFLGIEHWTYPDLCIFKNLKRIHGNKLRMMQFSLLVITDTIYLRELCLNSLQEVKAGGVAITGNQFLCHSNTVHWDKLRNFQKCGVACTDEVYDNAKVCRTIAITQNSQLCYADLINWDMFAKKIEVVNNKPKGDCLAELPDLLVPPIVVHYDPIYGISFKSETGKIVKGISKQSCTGMKCIDGNRLETGVKSTELFYIVKSNIALVNNRGLCHTSTLNWSKVFPHTDQTALLRRSSARTCPPCSSYCDSRDGCWGRKDSQCVTCLNYTDYTNEFGQFTEKWVVEPKTREVVPGHNVTTCVPVCDFKKGVYATPDHKCFPCDRQCNATCTGAGPTHCSADPEYGHSHGCKHVMYNGTCVEECPLNHYPDEMLVCQSCSPGCIDGGCNGPEDSYSDRGCTKCYFKYDESNDWFLYRGVQCQVCIDELKEEKCALGCIYSNSTQNSSCYEDPSRYYVYIIIAGVLLLICIPTLILLFRRQNTIRRMKKHIGDKIVGDIAQPTEFESPLTPSGNAPNQAQLRIVKEDELALGKTLGSGAFGAVYKAVWTSMYIENQRIQLPVAVKKLKDVSNCNEIMDEAYLMASVDNSYLVRLLGICMTEQVSLITQLMPLGSLLEYVRDNTDNVGSRRMLVWCTQIAKGMQYLEEKHLVHRDLAARNVLVKTPNHVKITDFGLAKMLNKDQSVYFAEGGKLPIKWLAIECITERQFSHQSDVWAFGVTCWEIFTFGERPYEGVGANQVLSLLERGQRLNQPSICTIDVYMILVKCWMVNPENRPRFSELVEEFTKMFNDHQRYIVIKNDPTHNMMSPTAEDETRFFRRLLEEDETNIDGNLITDDPDHYLLFHQNDHEPLSPRYTVMSSTTSTSSGEALYQNQSVVDQMQRQGAAHGVPASVHANGGNRAARLFSRQTPSAHIEPTSSQHLGMDPLMENGMLPSTSGRMSDTSNHDDVFASLSASVHAPLVQSKSLTVDLPGSEKGAEGGQVRYYHHRPHPAGTGARKNSEENPRYTEDPTTHRSSFDDIPPSHDGSLRNQEMLMDEEQYLLPTPYRKKPDYFDPSKSIPSNQVIQETMPKSHNLQNNTYLESEEVSPLLRDEDAPSMSRLNHKVSNVSSRDGKGTADSLPDYINTKEEHDYLNCGVRGDAMMSDVLLPKGVHNSREEGRNISGKRQDHRDMTFFTNEEYMATDSGIGEDNHSILSTSNGMQQSAEHPHHHFMKQPSRKRQNSSFSSAGSSSNGSMGPLISGSPAHRVRVDSNELQHEDLASGVVRYKPQPKPRQSLKKKNSNLNTGLDNPEYMMLQESTSATDDVAM